MLTSPVEPCYTSAADSCSLPAQLTPSSLPSITLFIQDSVSVEMIVETVAISKPVIIRFTKNDDSFYYYVLAEQQLIGCVDQTWVQVHLRVCKYFTSTLVG